MSDQRERPDGSFWADPDFVEGIVETSPVGITVVDDDGTVMFVNERAEEIYGRSREEIDEFAHDDPRWDLVDEDGEPLGADEAPFDRVVDGEEAIYDQVVGLRRPSGERVWVSVNGAPQWHENGDLERAVFAFEDITERRARERELREKERRYQAVFEDPNILVGLLEPDGTVVDINRTAMEYVDADLADVTGEPFWETPWWGGSDGVQAEVREWTERAADGEYVDFETDLTRPDGERYTISGYFRPVTDDDGEVVSIIVSDRDVTERKKRERELEESERRYRTLVENFPDGSVGLFDENYTYDVVGGELLDDLGLSPDDVVGTSIYGRYPDDLIDEIKPNFRAVFDGESTSFEIDLGDRDLLAHTLPVQNADGEIYAGMLLVRDVTERKARERELERALDLLEKTERIADVAGWEVDPETEEPYWSDHLFDLLDVDYDDQPSLEEALDVYHTEADRAIVEDAVEEALETGEGFDVEARFPRPAGDVGWLRVKGEPEVEDGEVVSLRGAVQDVTDQREYEQKLEESNERLEQFAYAASHDLQEPLRMVSSYLQLIEDRYADELDADGEEFLEYAVDGADRMREMIEGLLQYSRVDTRGDPFEPVDLDAVFADVRQDLQVKIAEADAEITAEDLPQVYGDGGQLNQVFQNLVDNAIEYSGDEPPRIHVAAERNGDEWIISVSDEGIGIDPEDADKVFEVFESLQAQDEAGTGIGLALVERIVERHGGDIWVDSEPGEGTTFSFSLPAAEEAGG